MICIVYIIIINYAFVVMLSRDHLTVIVYFFTNLLLIFTKLRCQRYVLFVVIDQQLIVFNWHPDVLITCVHNIIDSCLAKFRKLGLWWLHFIVVFKK
jgi:hypothetical protein